MLWVIFLAFAFVIWLVVESAILYMVVTTREMNYFIAGFFVFGAFIIWASFVSLRKRIQS
jgi:hypothetical protein